MVISRLMQPRKDGGLERIFNVLSKNPDGVPKSEFKISSSAYFNRYYKNKVIMKYSTDKIPFPATKNGKTFLVKRRRPIYGFGERVHIVDGKYYYEKMIIEGGTYDLLLMFWLNKCSSLNIDDVHCYFGEPGFKTRIKVNDAMRSAIRKNLITVFMDKDKRPLTLKLNKKLVIFRESDEWQPEDGNLGKIVNDQIL